MVDSSRMPECRKVQKSRKDCFNHSLCLELYTIANILVSNQRPGRFAQPRLSQ